MASTSIPVVLDTDIGTDVDDALALISALGAESIELLGVTTVYVDAPLRADIATRLLSLASADYPVWAGESVPLRPIALRLTAGPWEWHEGRGVLYDEVSIEEREHLNGLRPALREYQSARPDGAADGVDELIRLARERPGLEVVCIGPLTNIATAMQRDPTFAGLVGRLVVLGGFLAPDDEPRLEHNFCSDVGAAEVVFRSETPLTLLTADVTQFSFFDHERLEGLRALPTPLARTMDALISIYFERKARRHTYMHDPLTVAVAADPALARFDEVVLHLDTVDGRTRRRAGPTSVPKEVVLVKDVWLKESQAVLYERLLAVCGP